MGLDPVAVGIGALILMFILFFLEMPVGLSILLVAFIGTGLIKGFGTSLYVLANVPFKSSIVYVWSLIPLFVCMGQIAFHGGLGKDLFNAAYRLLGRLPGGLAITSVWTSAGFGAVCGDNIAAAVTMTSVCLPEMRKRNYDDTLSLGSICAGGLLSFLIPPSLGFIVYGILVNESISSLFIAGILPGILTTTLYMSTIIILCKINPKRGPRAPAIPWKERITSVRYLWGVAILVAIIFGGIYSGFITPSEAGALGAFSAIVIGIIKKTLGWTGFKKAIVSSLDTVGMIFLLLLGAWTFAPFLSLTTIPAMLVKGMVNWSPAAVMAFVMVFYFIGGLIFDSFILLIITIPVFSPIWAAVGFDMIWFGAVLMLMVVVGSITPPFGLIVYVVAGMVPEVPISKIFKGVLPFIPCLLISVTLVIIFPQIATWLPSLMNPT